MPLLAKIGRDDDEDVTFALRPFLRKNKTGFDCLSKTNLIGKQCTFGEWRTEGKEGGIHLMGIQIDLGPRDCSSQFLQAVRGTALGQLIGEILGVVIRELHGGNQ